MENVACKGATEPFALAVVKQKTNCFEVRFLYTGHIASQEMFAQIYIRTHTHVKKGAHNPGRISKKQTRNQIGVAHACSIKSVQYRVNGSGHPRGGTWKHPSPRIKPFARQRASIFRISAVQRVRTMRDEAPHVNCFTRCMRGFRSLHRTLSRHPMFVYVHVPVRMYVCVCERVLA